MPRPLNHLSLTAAKKTQIRNGLNRNRGALGIGQVTIHKTVQLYILVLVELNYARVLHVHSSIRKAPKYKAVSPFSAP